MQQTLSGTIWRVGAFVLVCLVAMAAMFLVFAQLRFHPEVTYKAIFSDASGMTSGNFVRIAGVEVGKVKSLSIQDDTTVVVEFSADPSVVLTEGSKAVIRYQDLIGGRYLALEEGAGGPERLSPGDTIPLSQTSPALDLDALIGGFRPLFRALNPDQVNALTGQLISAFQGEGETVTSVLTQIAALTNTLADRDQLIGQVVTNLHTVLGVLGDQSDKFNTAVESLSGLVDGLAARKEDITAGVAYANEAAGTIGDLLRQARPPLQQIVPATDQISSSVLADRDHFDHLLDTLPDSYRALGRLGLYGDFFSFYLCDLVLKVNGKGGQPVYVKLASQPSGRCAPR
ncbi:MCE family protein [Mycobacterium sp. DBP42]|uniref:MCE family protein n=1 Tax=Mycobacterium sp. DBP42 TaxID=2545267 RepID=UPI00110CC819|nr:MCE family protein [Mycobacterium sp. DBP42]TMS51194.1 MCE family protein [Mycobacterium sp. DBP42]